MEGADPEQRDAVREARRQAARRRTIVARRLAAVAAALELRRWLGW